MSRTRATRAYVVGSKKMTAVWVIILVVAIAFFVAMHAAVIPRLFLKVEYDIKSPTGRGIKTIREEGGRSIIYDADFSMRKYIPRYIVSERGGKKVLVCKLGKNVRYVDYDVVIFNHLNEIKDVLHFKEAVKEGGCTRAVDLPADTAYINLYLNAADGVEVARKVSGKISSKRWAAFLLACAAVEVITVFAVRACLANLFGGIFGEMFLYSSESNAIAVAICAGIIALNAVLMLIAVKGKNRRTKRGVKENAEQ